MSDNDHEGFLGGLEVENEGEINAVKENPKIQWPTYEVGDIKRACKYINEFLK